MTGPDDDDPASPAAAARPVVYEVLQPPDTLQKKVRIIPQRDGIKLDLIRNAERALAALSGNFDTWVAEQTTQLQTTHAGAVASDFEASALDEFFRAAHDLRGQAATLGYPLAGEIASSLCHILDNIGQSDRLPRPLMLKHVEAIRAVVAEKATAYDHEVGRSLCDTLRALAEEYVISQNGTEPAAG